MDKVEEILENFNKRVAQIKEEQKNVLIVNAGTMNHGKSSLFNSLLGKEQFKVDDVRTTITHDKALYRDNVYFVDTPGLNATGKDDETAAEAYQNASYIIFVHKADVGEMHTDEIKWIKKMKNMLSASLFGNHFCVVITVKDEFLAEKANGLSDIKNKIEKDLREKCGLYNIPIFCVSNTIYMKGQAKGKAGKWLVELSGMLEFKKHIDENIPKWQEELQKVTESKLYKAKQDANKELTKIRDKFQDKKRREGSIVAQKKHEIESDVSDVAESLEDLLSRKNEIEQSCGNAQYDYRNLVSQHNREKSQY